MTEDRGGSFCRADAVEILARPRTGSNPCAPSRDRAVPGAATTRTPRSTRAVDEGVRRRRAAAAADRGPSSRTSPSSRFPEPARNRLAVSCAARGRRVGASRLPSLPQPRDRDVPGVPADRPVRVRGLSERSWQPGGEVQVVLDADGDRHVVEIAPAKVSRTGRRSPGRRGATARRAASSGTRAERVVIGSGRPVERVGGREWHLAATGFWQAHRGAAETYAEVVGEWAQPSAGDNVWDLYGGVGVFAATLADQVGVTGRVDSVEFSKQAVADGGEALADLLQVRLHSARVERALHDLPTPDVVVLARRGPVPAARWSTRSSRRPRSGSCTSGAIRRRSRGTSPSSVRAVIGSNRFALSMLSPSPITSRASRY